MNKHTVLGLNDAEHKSKQLCGELTRRSRIAAGGGGIHALQREASCSGVTCPGGQSTPGGYSFRDSSPLRVTILIAYTSLSTLAGVNYYINTL